MMRPERGGGVAAGGGGERPPPSLWSTPTPYLFLCLAAIMAVIVVALLVLFCTRRKQASSFRRRLETEADGGKEASSVRALVPLDREEPKVVVIMAGEEAPSFLASARPLAVNPNNAAAEAAGAVAEAV